MVQVDQEGFDHLIDCDLRDFLRLDSAHQIRENPLHRLQIVCKRNCVHHFDLTKLIIPVILIFWLIANSRGLIFRLSLQAVVRRICLQTRITLGLSRRRFVRVHILRQEDSAVGAPNTRPVLPRRPRVARPLHRWLIQRIRCLSLRVRASCAGAVVLRLRVGALRLGLVRFLLLVVVHGSDDLSERIFDHD